MIDELIKQYDDAIKDLTNKIISALKTEFGKIFDKYPELSYFTWKQYTPSWNDGEPCYFNVYGDEPSTYNEDGDELENYDASNEIGALVCSIPQGILETLGEGEVRVYREIIRVEDCDHE
jgi:hypothetical protein